MILRIKAQPRLIENYEILREKFFPNMRITRGYITSFILENHTNYLSEKNIFGFIEESDKKVEGNGIPVNLNITTSANEKLYELKAVLDGCSGRSFFPAQIVDMLAMAAVKSLETKNEKDSLSFFHWNIHCSGGFNNVINVALIIDQIIKHDPDVIDLVEFVASSLGACELIRLLEECGYNVYTTKYIPEKNGILIAVKKEIASKYIMENKEFLKLELLLNNKIIQFAGARILTQGNFTNYAMRYDLFKEYCDYFDNEKEYIMMLDANCGAAKNESDTGYEYEAGTPRSYYSLQHIFRFAANKNNSVWLPDKGVWGNKYSKLVDYNNIKLKVKSDIALSSIDEKFIECDYDWNFISKSYGYGDYTCEDDISELPLPDHALFLSKLKLS